VLSIVKIQSKKLSLTQIPKQSSLNLSFYINVKAQFSILFVL